MASRVLPPLSPVRAPPGDNNILQMRLTAQQLMVSIVLEALDLQKISAKTWLQLAHCVNDGNLHVPPSFRYYILARLLTPRQSVSTGHSEVFLKCIRAVQSFLQVQLDMWELSPEPPSAWAFVLHWLPLLDLYPTQAVRAILRRTAAACAPGSTVYTDDNIELQCRTAILYAQGESTDDDAWRASAAVQPHLFLHSFLAGAEAPLSLDTNELVRHVEADRFAGDTYAYYCGALLSVHGLSSKHRALAAWAQQKLKALVRSRLRGDAQECASLVYSLLHQGRDDSVVPPASVLREWFVRWNSNHP